MKARRLLLNVVAALGLAGSQSAFAMVCEFLSDYPPPTPYFLCERQIYYPPSQGYSVTYTWGFNRMQAVSGSSWAKTVKCISGPQPPHAVWVNILGTYQGAPFSDFEGEELGCLTF